MGSGSSRMRVVSFDRGDQGGSNGTSLRVAVAVLAEIWSDKVERYKIYIYFKRSMVRNSIQGINSIQSFK
jgi:hypothetical protein